MANCPHDIDEALVCPRCPLPENPNDPARVGRIVDRIFSAMGQEPARTAEIDAAHAFVFFTHLKVTGMSKEVAMKSIADAWDKFFIKGVICP